MYKKLAVDSTEVEKSFDKYLDSMNTGRPLIVNRREDYVIGLDLNSFKKLVQDVTFRIEVIRENDGDVILTLDGYDLIASASTWDEAVAMLIDDFREYVQDYFDEVEVWSQDKHRAGQVKELLKVLVTESNEELGSTFTYYENCIGEELIKHLIDANWKEVKTIQCNDTAVEMDLWDKVCMQPIDSQHTKLVVLVNGRVGLEVIIDLGQRYQREWNTNMYYIRELQE